MRIFLYYSLVFMATFAPLQVASAQWDPPVGFYDAANGSGQQLKDQLTSVMSNGHIERRYGDFRFSAAIHDQDPDQDLKIKLVYDGASVDAAWDSGATWNREHVWPQSRQPGSASNSTRGNLGDPHALRPSDPGINSSRGNKPYGFGDTVGEFGSLGAFWFPGDGFKGSVARSLFYSDTRWASLGISLTDGTPAGNQMGDLSSMIEWHYLNPPDEFERRRNHAIYSQDLNPEFYTNNRNAFVDRPEFVWSVYVDQANDSMISIDGSNQMNGASSLSIDFGAIIVGAGAPALTQSVTINKDGNDGTYYSVETFDNAASQLLGRHNAFRTGGTDAESFDVSLNANASTPGINIGLVVVDNLDVTTQGGGGRGANDADDVIDMAFAVLDHSNASFSNGADENLQTVDLGEIELGQPIQPFSVQISNLESPFGGVLTADLELFSVDLVPGSSGLQIDGPLFDNLAAGDSRDFVVSGAPGELGSQQVVAVFVLSDEDLPGAATEILQLSMTFTAVEPNFVLGDVNGDGAVNLLDVEPFVAILTAEEFQIEADINQDGVVNLLDVSPFVALL